MATPPGLFGKMKDLKMRDNHLWPYIWNRDVKPKNKRGKRCKIVETPPKHKAQGLVFIQFQLGGPAYLVKKSGLKRASPQS